MPAKSNTYKRPPSPYSVSQSPRHTESKKHWRQLNGTSQPAATNSFSESMRERWLRSLRQGTDVRRTPMKAFSGNRQLNSSMGSSNSEYLREQLSFSTSTPRERRRNSIGAVAPGTPRYKSQEDMYDEILALKKTAVVQKQDADLLKAKNRRLEEENIRKEKYIGELLDPRHDESISGLTDRKTAISALKQRQMKLEKQLRDKEQEVAVLKSDLKLTDIEEMRSAMEIYYQEVLRLRKSVSSHEANAEKLSSRMSESDAVPTKIKTLRKSVLQLTEENQSLKRDLNRALDGDTRSDSDGDYDDGSVRYSAMNKVELVSMIKKLKQSERQKRAVESDLSDAMDKQKKMERVVEKLKEERNMLHSENDTLQSVNTKLQDALEKLESENENLHEMLDDSKRKRVPSPQRTSSTRELKSRRSSVEQSRAATSIQRKWREHRANQVKNDGDIVMLQSALRGHLARKDHSLTESLGNAGVDDSYDSDTYISESELSEDGVVTLQSAMRGHLERTRKVPVPVRRRTKPNYTDDDEESDSDDDDVVVMRSTSRP